MTFTRDGYTYKSLSRWIKVRERSDGSHYFVFQGKRWNLHDFPYLTIPIFFDDHDGKLHYISCCYAPDDYKDHYFIHFGRRCYYYLETGDCLESIRVWAEYKEEE